MNFGASIKLFTIGGTAVRLHPTIFLLLAWISGMQWLETGPAAALAGIVMVGIVDQGQRLVGYVTAENFAELVMTRGAGEARPNP